jgi:hypothetical protein
MLNPLTCLLVLVPTDADAKKIVFAYDMNVVFANFIKDYLGWEELLPDVRQFAPYAGGGWVMKSPLKRLVDPSDYSMPDRTSLIGFRVYITPESEDDLGEGIDPADRGWPDFHTHADVPQVPAGVREMGQRAVDNLVSELDAEIRVRHMVENNTMPVEFCLTATQTGHFKSTKPNHTQELPVRVVGYPVVKAGVPIKKAIPIELILRFPNGYGLSISLRDTGYPDAVRVLNEAPDEAHKACWTQLTTLVKSMLEEKVAIHTIRTVVLTAQEQWEALHKMNTYREEKPDRFIRDCATDDELAGTAQVLAAFADVPDDVHPKVANAAFKEKLWPTIPSLASACGFILDGDLATDPVTGKKYRVVESIPTLGYCNESPDNFEFDLNAHILRDRKTGEFFIRRI